MAFDLQKIAHLKTEPAFQSILWQENVMNSTCDYTIVWAQFEHNDTVGKHKTVIV